MTCLMDSLQVSVCQWISAAAAPPTHQLCRRSTNTTTVEYKTVDWSVWGGGGGLPYV